MDAIPRKQAVLTIAAYAALVAVAAAQPGGRRGGPGGPGGGMGGLLRNDDVRSELGIAESQVEELQSLESEMRDRMRSMFQEMRDGGGGFDRDAMREKFMEMRKEGEERLAEVLDTSQMERLKQINFQQQIERGGSRALMGGPIADALGLSDAQQEQMRERAREIESELQEQIRAARAEAREKLLEVLTPEQRATLEQMTGEPFAMTQRQGPPRGGDREGGRGGFGRRGGDREGGRFGRGGGPGGRRGGGGRPEPEL